MNWRNVYAQKKFIQPLHKQLYRSGQTNNPNIVVEIYRADNRALHKMSHHWTSLEKFSPPLRPRKSTCTGKNQILNIYDTNLSSEEQGIWKEHQHWATSALLLCYWRQLHSRFLTYCVAWHEMRQHSCQDFCFIIVSTQPCYEIHSCRAVFFCTLQNFSGHLKFLVFKDVYLGVSAVQIRYRTVM